MVRLCLRSARPEPHERELFKLPLTDDGMKTDQTPLGVTAKPADFTQAVQFGTNRSGMLHTLTVVARKDAVLVNCSITFSPK